MKTIKVAKGASFQSTLRRMSACPDSRMWVGRKSLRAAWRRCDRGDWMLWLAASAQVDPRLVVRAACDCARLALVFVPSDEPRPLRAIESAEGVCEGKKPRVNVLLAKEEAMIASRLVLEAKPGFRRAAEAAAYAAHLATYMPEPPDRYVASNVTHLVADAFAESKRNSFHALGGPPAALSAYTEALERCADLIRARIPAGVIEAAVREGAWR